VDSADEAVAVPRPVQVHFGAKRVPVARTTSAGPS